MGIKSKAEQWIEAGRWWAATTGVPNIVSHEISRQVTKALQKAKPYKASIKIPKGEQRKSLSWLKKELDRVFSIFIRTRGNKDGISVCVTCGLRKLWRDVDAGHYMPRQDIATRWDVRNVHSQCKKCNCFRGGEQEKMAAYIDAMYGDGTAFELRVKSRLKTRLDRGWMEDRIDHYKARIGEK